MKKLSSYPYLIWMILFTIIPMFLILYYSLTTQSSQNVVWTLEHFQRAFEPIYLKVFGRSMWLAFLSTVICFFLGYPVAYILADRNFNTKPTVLFLFLVPMWMNFLLRTYSWLSILERNGILNNFLQRLGLPAFNILYTEYAVILGMVYNFLPFMILPIYSVLRKMDKNIIEAAQDLGANPFHVFSRIVFPLSFPGVASGVTMVFMPAVTTFVIPELLGGGQYMLVGSLIEQQFKRVGDKNFGSAISILLMALILLSSFLFSLKGQKDEEGGGLF